MLIGLAGYAGCGKTTCAEYLVNHHSFVEVGFADPLKDGLCTMLGMTRKELEKIKEDKTVLPGIGQTARYMMQTLGTDWGRNMVNPDLWLMLAGKRIMQMMQDIDKSRVVVSDVRFINEAVLIRDLCGIVVFIDSKSRTQDRLSQEESSHESESYLKCIYERSDVIVDNNGTMLSLHGRLDDLLRSND
jgi:dephospho-CoA kinase